MDNAAAPVLNAAQLAACAHQSASLRLLPPSAQFIFRGGMQAVDEAGQVFGLAMPATPCRAATAADRAALWLGPDEWLLLAPSGFTLPPLTNPHALVAVGHRNVAMEIAGPRATDILNAGCPLNLAESAFPVGMCTRTVLARAQIVLWRQGPALFTINAWRSFVPYVWDFLIEARTRL